MLGTFGNFLILACGTILKFRSKKGNNLPIMLTHKTLHSNGEDQRVRWQLSQSPIIPFYSHKRKARKANNSLNQKLTFACLYHVALSA